MKHPCEFAFLAGLLGCLMMISSVQAGQVVTEKERNWARRALAREASLDAAQMPENTLSVLYFTNLTGQTTLDPLSKGLAYLLMTDLAKISGLVVVERIKLQALLDEIDLGASDLVAPGTAPRLGRILGARFMVSGEIAGGAEVAAEPAVGEAAVSRALEIAIRLDPKLLNVPNSDLQTLPYVDGLIHTLFELEKKVLFAIVERLEIALSEGDKEALRIPLSTNPRALYYFFMGLNASDLQMYDRAGGYYEKATREDPGLKPAGDALKELRRLGLYAAPKKPRSLLKSVRQRTSLTNSLGQPNALRRVRTPADVEQRDRRINPLDYIDEDGDGYPASVDCNDGDPTINPGAVEDCSNIDRNCNGDFYDAPNGC